MTKLYPCPACKHEIQLDEPDLMKDNVITCEDCGAEYMILSVKPFRTEPLEEQ